jgi:hypothetical protein
MKTFASLPPFAPPIAMCLALAMSALGLVTLGCSGHPDGSFFATDSGPSGKGGSGGFLGSDGGGNNGSGNTGTLGGSGGSDSGGGAAVSVIYAHTDTELYSMDPTTHAVTDIGPFQLNGASMQDPVTDLAVDAEGNVWVNTESDVYRASVPTTPGPVALTLHTSTSSKSRFYALGFAPAGVLGSAEGLVAGDGNGELWYIDTSTTNATPQDLGGFGSDPNGDAWELSGDVVFYTDNGAPTGLATIRSCGSSGSCSKSNDYLAAVDMSALAQAYSSGTPGTLLKATYGSGTGYGELFGLGAWGDVAYGFAREQGSGTPAQLVEINGSTGQGTSLQTFPSISSGWSGAGVTTAATISVPAPM